MEKRPAPRQLLVAGANVTLPCRFLGDPLPRVTWSRRGGHLPFKRAKVVPGLGLTLTSLTPRDEGTYVCHGENDVGDQDVETELVVQGKD